MSKFYVFFIYCLENGGSFLIIHTYLFIVNFKLFEGDGFVVFMLLLALLAEYSEMGAFSVETHMS
jgi:hypothetical protein